MTNGKGKVKEGGVEVKDLAKTVAEAAAAVVEKSKHKEDPKGATKGNENPKGATKGAVNARVPEKKVNLDQLANETITIATRPSNVPDILGITKAAALKAVETKTKTATGRDVTTVKISVLSETVRKLRELKKVLGSNLPTAINRVELDANGLIFEFYVKFGRGPIYVKRATGATGLVCKSVAAKKKTTAGDMRSVHLVTLKISASKVAASQVIKVWKLLNYSISAPKA